jgi:cobalamin biosynthesis protein CobT
MLSCHAGRALDAHAPTQSRSISSRAEGSSSRAHEEEEDDDDGGEEDVEQENELEEEEQQVEESEDENPDYDEIDTSQFGDAPEPTQPSQPTTRTRKAKKIFSPIEQRVPPTRRSKLTSKRGRKK